MTASVIGRFGQVHFIASCPFFGIGPLIRVKLFFAVTTVFGGLSYMGYCCKVTTFTREQAPMFPLWLTSEMLPGGG